MKETFIQTMMNSRLTIEFPLYHRGKLVNCAIYNDNDNNNNILLLKLIKFLLNRDGPWSVSGSPCGQLVRLIMIQIFNWEGGYFLNLSVWG